nr:hypothetical protein [Tanacetum cinerariifolium]
KRSGDVTRDFAGLVRMGYEKPSTKLTFYKAFFSTQWKFFIHTILHSLSAKRTSWNKFSSTMASSVLICLSSDDVENVFNQGRIIVDIDQDEGIELVTDQEMDAEVEGRYADKQANIYNINLDHSSKVLSMQEDDTEVAASTPIPAAKPKTLTITAAPAVSTRRRNRVVIRDPEEELPSDTPAKTPKVKDKGKGILIEALKPIKKKDQIEIDAKYARKL